jgi:hypothetical protein
MGRTRNTYERDEKYMQNFGQKTRREENLEGLGINGRILE